MSDESEDDFSDVSDTFNTQRFSAKTGQTTNQHYDEAFDVTDDDDDSATSRSSFASDANESVASPSPPRRTTGVVAKAPVSVAGRGGDSPPKNTSADNGSPDNEFSASSGEVNTSEEQTTPYNPADFANLPVSAEVKEIFAIIGQYTPHNIELEAKLKPFIPDYIPAVGDIDPFLKIPRPDKKPDYLGLQVLDEPSAIQSDPYVIDLMLRQKSKSLSSKKNINVRGVEMAHQNPKEIQNWVANIKKINSSKPPTVVQYSKPMPDVEQLMQVWPPEFEDLLQQVELPSADVDLSVEDYVKVVCTMLDIPVHQNIVESLHILFTLYSEFKSNQHFNAQQ